MSIPFHGDFLLLVWLVYQYSLIWYYPLIKGGIGVFIYVGVLGSPNTMIG